ncbi:hypothetical protein [Marinobacter sp. MIT932201]|uniref:hypothetical protein n=1 Tax=Marinobacter sp. MIT932201 TaxID=3096995 RepID=UPI0039995EF8
MKENLKVGCGTLALGLEYRVLARLLAYDLGVYHPDLVFYVLTDDPESFEGFSNVRAIKHEFSGVRACYHDKRHVVSEIFKDDVDICVFLDADSRLVYPIDFSDLIKDGFFLVATWAKNLSEKHGFKISEWDGRWSFNNPKKEQALFDRLTMKFGIRTSEVDFVKESLFAINKNHGDYELFLKAWDYCATYSTIRLFEFSEGSSIGISAKVAGGRVYSMSKTPVWYFKDIYTNVALKTEAQRNINLLMTKLRHGIGKDCRSKSNVLVMSALFVWRYIKVYVKNKRHLFKKPLY